MLGWPQQQAYDRAITIFSPDGRLYQVEYAREAVKRGAAALGLRTTESVILLVDKGEVGPLVEATSIEKLHKVDTHLAIATAGHVADGRHLVDFARRQAQIERLRYAEPLGVEAITKTITDYMQLYTQSGGVRPFGVALLIGGIENGAPRLYEADPGGAPREWRATAIGGDHASLLDELETRYADDLDHDEGLGVALSSLAEVMGGPLRPDGVGISAIMADPVEYVQYGVRDIETRLDALDLLDEPSDDAS